MRAATLRAVPKERNPSLIAETGAESGASVVPVLDPVARLATGETVTGRPASRVQAGVELGLEVYGAIKGIRAHRAGRAGRASRVGRAARRASGQADDAARFADDGVKYADDAADAARGGARRRGGETAYTRAGRAKHRHLKELAERKPGWRTGERFVDPNTGRTVVPDAVSPKGHPVELKPRSPSGIRKGRSQKAAQVRATGATRGRVIYYEPPKIE